MLFFSPSRGKTYNIPEDKVAGFLAKVPDAIPAEEGATPVPSAAPPAASVATQPAPPSETSLLRDLEALGTAGGRGLMAEFADELAGAGWLVGSKLAPAMFGVSPEAMAEQDWYALGREEEQARQHKLQEESPWLTGAGQVAGAIAPALLTGGATAPTTLGARFAAAAPAAAGYGAATGVGRTDILGTEQGAAATLGELAQNVATDVGAGLAGAGFGAAGGQAAARTREALAKRLAAIGAEADKLRVATAGPAALKAAEKGQGGVDVKEAARVMREVGLGGVKTPAAIKAGAEKTEEEAGALIGRIVDEVDAASGGFLKKAQDARSQAAQLAEQIDSVVAQKQATADEARRLVSLATEKLERAREAQNISVLRGGKKAMTRQEAMQILQSHAENPEAIEATAVAQARSVVSMPAGAPAPTDGAAYNQMLAGLKADVDELTKRADAASREVIAARNTDQSKAVADLIKQAEQAEAQAAARRVSGDEIAKRLESQARDLMTQQGAQAPGQLDELTSKTYKKLVGAADQMRGRQLSLSEAQGRLRPLAVTARFEAGAPDIKVTAAAKGAREQSRAIREQMDVAAEEAFPTMAATPALESPLARVGKGARLTEPPTGRTGYQSARRVYDVMQDIVPSAEQQAARIRSEYGMLNPRRYAESYLPGLQASGAELAQTMAPKAETAFLTPQERALRSLPYGAVTIEDMLRQIDEESAP